VRAFACADTSRLLLTAGGGAPRRMAVSAVN